MANLTCFWSFWPYGSFWTKIKLWLETLSLILDLSALEQKNMFCLIWSKGIKIFPKWSQMLDWSYRTIFDRVWPLWEVCHIWPNGYKYLIMTQPNCNYKTKTEYVVFNKALIISRYTKNVFQSEQGIILSSLSTHHGEEKNWMIFFIYIINYIIHSDWLMST